MTDIISIVIAALAIYFIMKITFKLLKVVLVLAVIAVLAYILMNYGFLSGQF
ncbi:MAG: hypothetical protein PWR01_1148 [Clostridiales bacterium]|jgi:uncharacterized membrane protein YcaP (DUF421 family)|nr:hypothetical protein [Clostridiales bacterium]